MPNILDRYAHDFRGIRMGEKELRKMLKAFVMELLLGEKTERSKSECYYLHDMEFLVDTFEVKQGYNSCRQEIIERIGEK